MPPYATSRRFCRGPAAQCGNLAANVRVRGAGASARQPLRSIHGSTKFPDGLGAGAPGPHPRLFGSPSDTVRVGCIGIGGRGRDHLSGFGRLPNVEIAAVAISTNRTLARAARRSRRPGARSRRPTRDFRKLLEDKSIDAVSIATPNHWHTLMAIWACQAGKDVYVEKPCSPQHFRGAADCRGGAQVQPHGAAWAARSAPRRRCRKRCRRCATGRIRRGLHGARPVLQVARHHRPHAGNAGARRRRLRSVDRPCARCAPSRRTASTTTGTGSGTPATATSATRASTRWISRAGAWA